MLTIQHYKIGNNIDLIQDIKDKSIDLVVTSPPYDNLRDYDGKSNFQFKEIANELYRVTKNGGVIVWIVGDQTINGSETCTSFKQAIYFNKIGFNLHDTMIYKKMGIIYPDTNRYYQNFEYMFIFSKGNPKTFNPIKDRKNKYSGYKMHGKTRNQNGEFFNRSCHGKIIEPFGVRYNVWEIPASSTEFNNVSQHPATFPQKLVEDHIKSWSNEGDMVLDPFLGSGTTLKACRLLNRNGIGFEINPKYESIIKDYIMINIPQLESYYS